MAGRCNPFLEYHDPGDQDDGVKRRIVTYLKLWERAKSYDKFNSLRKNPNKDN